MLPINQSTKSKNHSPPQQQKPLQTQTPPSLKKLPSLILLDRDGVINIDVGSPGVTSPTQLRLTPHAAQSIGNLKRAGCNVALVTNQSCVGKKLITSLELDMIQQRLFEMLCKEDENAVIDKVYCCTSVKESGDERMKPSPGMILEAKRDFNVDNHQCVVFVGDTLTDMQAAKGGGVENRILVSTGYGLSIMGEMKAPKKGGILIEQHSKEYSSLSLPSSALPFIYVENLATAVSWILGENMV